METLLGMRLCGVVGQHTPEPDCRASTVSTLRDRPAAMLAGLTQRPPLHSSSLQSDRRTVHASLQ